MSARAPGTAPGALEGPLAETARAAGVVTVADVLERAEYVRDLPERSNHVLVLGAQRLYVKRTKPHGFLKRVPRLAPEARGIGWLEAAEVPTARVALVGRDRRLGCLAATFDLAPAKPLDELLATGALAPEPRRVLFDRLATVVARLHGAGLHHRDLYLNHLLHDPACGALTLIDAERVGRHRRALGRPVVKDLAALRASGPTGTWDDGRWDAFLASYVRARGVSSALTPVLARRVARKAARIARHRPRTPVGPEARPPHGA